MIYCCEAMEHAVDIENAVKELTRVIHREESLLLSINSENQWINI